MAFTIKDFMLGLSGGLNANGQGASGLLSGIAGGYNAVKDNQAYSKGIEQINAGDWQGGINTIAERNPDVALGLSQYKQKQDDAMNIAQMKIAADIQNRNTLTPYQQEMLALKRQQLEQNGGGTGSIKNIEYLVGQGYTPEQAANMVFSGQNPAVAGLGEKGYNKYGETMGKSYAEDINELRNLEANLPALQEMVSDLDSLAKKATYTKAGQAFDVAETQLFGKATEGGKASAAYETMVNQNLLPLLRQTFGAAFTEKDREALQKTLGDPYAHPDIKKQTLESFIRNKQREIESKRRKVESYVPKVPQEQVIINYEDLE